MIIKAYNATFGQEADTPWRGQSHTCTHSCLRTVWVNLTCSWTEGGIRSTWKEHMQAQGKHANITKDPMLGFEPRIFVM